MPYRCKQLLEVLVLSSATAAELAAWNIDYDPTMAGMVAIREQGSMMVSDIRSEAEFAAGWVNIPA